MISRDARVDAQHYLTMGVRSLLITPLLLLVMTTSARAVPQFTLRPPVGTAIDPWSVAIGHLDADGQVDLAVACWSSHTVNAFLGNGNGTFDFHGDQGPMGHPRSVAIADLNADGISDLVTAADVGVAVLLGHGDGSFGPMVAFATGAGPEKLAVADLNADGRPDVATANYFARTVSVLLGNGDGTLQPTTDYPSGTGTSAVALSDLNGDGKIDLVSTDHDPITYDPFGEYYEGGEVKVRLGNGDGTFGSATAYYVGLESSPFAVAIADLNADGRPDLVTVITGQNYYGHAIAVLLGNGDGTFGGPTRYNTGYGPQSVGIADFDHDGNLDVATANSSEYTVSVLAGNGNGTFQPRVDFAIGNQTAIALAVGDLNQDGWADLAVAQPYANAVVVMLNSIALADSPLDPAIGESALNLVAPNPTLEGSRIHYTVARSGPVRLEVADVAGRVVTTLFDGFRGAGRFEAAWDGTTGGERLPAGIYFVRLTTADRTVATRITRLR